MESEYDSPSYRALLRDLAWAGVLEDEMPEMYRQGDLLLIRVGGWGSEPDEVVGVLAGIRQGVVREPEGERLILARGEVTGHHHSVACHGADLVQTAEAVYLRIMAPTPLEHQEHAPIWLEPGTYEVRRQREYQPGELPRQVAD